MLLCESLEGYPVMALGDDMDMRAHADIPMAAIWTNYKPTERDGILNHIVDMQGAASVAHVFGKPVVAVEALTSWCERASASDCSALTARERPLPSKFARV